MWAVVSAWAGDAIEPGTAASPHPTFRNLSIEWPFAGDDDGDSAVTARFRGPDGAWRDAMPLFRVGAGANEGFAWDARHAGSVFELQPDTAYTVELTLTDPDGGGTTTSLDVHTRRIPEVAADARRVDVTPATLDAALGDLRAGDHLVLAAGTYGSVVVDADGTEERPIVIEGEPGAAVQGEVRLDGTRDVMVRGLAVDGQVKLNGAVRPAVVGCAITASLAEGNGIVAYGDGSTDGWFADNTISGQTTWREAALGVDGDNLGEGIVVTGPGNVIEHNAVHGFRDCVSLLEDGEAVDQVSVDILWNDLWDCADDAVEADFAMGNVRVVGNRATNVFIGLSSQPSLGGPTWFVRNSLVNVVFQAYKPNRGSVGDVWLHNTVIKPGDAMGVWAGVTWSSALFRNNLFLGGVGGGEFGGYDIGDGDVLDLPDADGTCSFDWDGLGSHGTGTFDGRIGGDRFDSFAALVASGHEAHAVEVSLADFATIEFPSEPFPGVPFQSPDLVDGAAAVDRGTPLPNVSDGFAGGAPDLGAIELGSGPRPWGPRGEPVCGDGIADPSEGCDDGNLLAGDGCDPGCAPEDGGTLPGGDDDDDGGGGGGGDDGGGGGPDPKGCGCGHRGGAPWLAIAIAAFVRRRRAVSSP